MRPARTLVLLFGILLLGLLAPGHAAATAFVSGDFLAISDCPAWVSKEQQTNPDETRLVPGRIYPITQINIAEAPDAYRLEVPGANPKDRWVPSSCGEFPPKSNPNEVAARFAADKLEGQSVVAGLACPNPPPSKDPCRACGKSAYNVLSLVWLPARCEQSKGKPERPPECDSLDAEAYAARNLSLGEMRPALNKCKKTAGFCGAVDKEMKPYTAYPDIALSEANLKALAQVLPAVALNTGIERHQWFKHGTCTGLPENGYFQVLTDLVRQFNQTGPGNVLAEARGNKIRRDDFYQQVEELLGKNARKRVNLVCSRDGKSLLEVQVYLPSKILPGYDIKELMADGPAGGGGGNCGSKFLVPALGADVPVDADPVAEPEPGSPHRRRHRSGQKDVSAQESSKGAESGQKKRKD
jgi:ribonuclease T2